MNDALPTRSESAPAYAINSAALGAVAEDVFEFVCRGADGEVKWVDHVVNRVTTVGLNLLLNGTFIAPNNGSTTWYVGLMGSSAGSITTVSGSAGIIDAPESPWTTADSTRAFLGKSMGAAGADLSTTLTYVSGSSVTLGATCGATLTGTGVAAWDLRPTDTAASHAPWSEAVPYSGNRPAWTPGAVASGSVTNSASPASFSITVPGPTNIFGSFIASANSGTAGTLYGGGLWQSGVVRSVVAGDTLTATVLVALTAT